MTRKPKWLRVDLTCGASFGAVRGALEAGRLNTVCVGAKCPNRGECWAKGTATFMILGSICTRGCAFCGVGRGVPEPPDAEEPARVAEAAEKLGLKYVVVTSVTRDDLPDGGARHWAETVAAVRARIGGVRVEILTPDFNNIDSQLDVVFASRPDVFAHNIETVARLQKIVRVRADYAKSLAVLSKAAAAGLPAKSGLMLGLGETESEVRSAMRDLRGAGVTMLTIGQYIAPTERHFPVDRWVEPAEFAAFADEARALGFTFVKSAPLVRSSYNAQEAFL